MSEPLTAGVDLGGTKIQTVVVRNEEVVGGVPDQAVWGLALGLASAQNLIDLEAIIIGGGLGDRLGPPFVERIVEQMQPHLFADDDPPVVLPTELGDLSGAVGAAVLVGG